MPSSRSERNAHSSRSSGKKSKKSSSDSNSGLIVGGIAGGGVLLLLVGGVVFFLNNNGDDAPAAPPAAPAIAATTPMAPPLLTTPAQPLAQQPGTTTPPIAPPTPTPNPAPTANPATQPVSTEPELPQLPELALPDLIEKVKPSVVRIAAVSDEGPSGGSGFVVDKSGVVVTNYHVVEGANRLSISFSNGHTGTVKGYMKLIPEKDLAVLQIEADPADIVPIPIAAKLPRDGETVLACGAPYGLGFTNTQGIISATRTPEELRKFGTEKQGTWIQTSTPISPGNSGGPLMNMRGEVVAANTFVLTIGQNLNFGISCLDIAQAVKERSETLIAVNSSSTPAKDSKTPTRVKIKDITGTERAAKLLGSIEELNVVLRRRADYAYNSTLRDYIEGRIKQGLREAGMKLGDSERSIMMVTMDLDGVGSGKGNYKLTISAEVIMVDADAQGNEEVVKIWENEEVAGTIPGTSISQGQLPDRVKTKLMTFFKEFAEAAKSGRPTP